MNEEPMRRRGRPPVDLAQAQETVSETPVPKSGRRRRSTSGTNALKLSAPQRQGYTRRWVNDDRNRIAEADELAYDFVHEAGITSSDPGTRISRLVGTKANGEPLRAYLMESPDELYAEGVAEKEALARKTDEAIAAGRDLDGHHQSDGYVGQGSITRDR